MLLKHHHLFSSGNPDVQESRVPERLSYPLYNGYDSVRGTCMQRSEKSLNKILQEIPEDR